ncbi:MAG TPA: hypothetical protein VFV97_01165, partial [Rhodanobacteraceae bacterium]|nr:hypothetical protein [Rhodanobacteraceae bacterium]
ALMLTHTADGAAVESHASYAYIADEGPVAWREGSGFARVTGSALLALDRDERPAAPDLADLRKLVRSIVRDLVGGQLNAWTLSSRRIVDAIGGARKPDASADFV